MACCRCPSYHGREDRPSCCTGAMSYMCRVIRGRQQRSAGDLLEGRDRQAGGCRGNRSADQGLLREPVRQRCIGESLEGRCRCSRVVAAIGYLCSSGGGPRTCCSSLAYIRSRCCRTTGRRTSPCYFGCRRTHERC